MDRMAEAKPEYKYSNNKMKKWSPGLPLQLEAAVRGRGKEILMAATVKMWIEEEDRFVNNQLLSPYFGKVMFGAAEYVFSIHFYDDALIVPAHSDAYKTAIDVKQ
jgi:hypothetical protein